MINAKELRIGNIILEDGNNQVVDHNTITECYFSADRFKPIPLTEEWLIKFGFKYLNGYGYQKAGFQGSIHAVSRWCYHNIKVEIKHVHQLQNLFHALTQKELNIK